MTNEKLAFEGSIVSVQPRIRLTRSLVEWVYLDLLPGENSLMN